MSRVVPVQSDVNANKPFFAPLGSGGGTGGAGPNPSFSTISFPVSDQSNAGVVNYTGVLCFNDSTTAVKNTITFQNGNNLPGIPADVTNIQLNAASGTGAIMLVGAADDGSSYISATNTGSNAAPLVLAGASVNMSNLIVSSINGAIPYEGAANPNPTFSSITMSPGAFSQTVSTGVISMSNVLNISQPGRTSGGNSGYLPIVSIGDSTNPDVSFIPFSTNFIQITSPDPSVNPAVFLNLGASLGGGSFICSGTTDTAALSSLSLIADGVNISSLNVSSINGAAPGSGGANPIVSSLTLGFPGGGPPAPLLVQHNSSTDPGNYTTIQADVLNYSSSINNRIDPVVYVSTGATRVPGNFGAGLLVLGDTASTQGYFTDNPYITNSNSTLQLIATTDVVIPNNLVVSSINGAAPGGGVLSANPSFSSITFPPGGGGVGAINISTSMFINGLGGGSNSSYVFQPNFGILGSVRNVLTFRAPNTSNTQMLISQGDDATSRIDCTDAGVNTGSLGIFALTTISTLNVSTINGTAVVGASDMSTLQGQMAEVRSTLGFV